MSISVKTESALLEALRKLNLQATVTDLTVQSGLGRVEVEEALPVLVSERRGHLRVTESGEVLYYFPKGLASQVKGFGPWLKSAFRGFVKGLGAVLSFLFKIWIMVMLVGYFVLFLALLVLGLVASVAGASSKDSRSSSRDSGRGGNIAFFLATRIFDLILNLWLYSNINRKNKQSSEPKRPFHLAVFSFVFGEKDPVPAWEEKLRSHLAQRIVQQRGVITLDQIQESSGLDRENANALFSKLLLEYKGEPQVSDQGTLYGWFPELLRTYTQTQTVSLGPIPTRPFSNNPKGTNPWIIFFNLFNLIFGGYFTWYTLLGGQGSDAGIMGQFATRLFAELFGAQSTESILIWGLAAVPLTFSVLFFLVPIIRWMVNSAANKKIQYQNRRRAIIRQILEQPSGFALENKEDQRLVMDMAETRKLEVESRGSGMVYSLPDLVREKSDLLKIQSTVDTGAYKLGKTVYDSGT